MPYILMKVFEECPRRFDLWMHLLTRGRLRKIKEEIATHSIPVGTRVLEIGCGTGSFAALLASRGIQVVGIDTSPDMLSIAREEVSRAGLPGSVEFKRLSALEIEDAFDPETFDCVVNLLVLSEMSDAEIDCVLLQCRQILHSQGRLIVVDEVEPAGLVRRWCFRALRFPIRLLTFLILQAKDLKSANPLRTLLYYVIEFPLMLLTFVVVPPATHPLSRLEERIEQAGFRIVSSQAFLGETMRFLQAERAS